MPLLTALLCSLAALSVDDVFDGERADGDATEDKAVMVYLTV